MRKLCKHNNNVHKNNKIQQFSRVLFLYIALCTLLFLITYSLDCNADSQTITGKQTWPPQLTGAINGTVRLKSPLFLKIPNSVKTIAKKTGSAAFTVAKIPPTVDLAFHSPLPNPALNGTGWSAWGDICVANNGMVYCGIGDHGNAKKGKSFCFLFRWNPQTRKLEKIVDLNKIVPRHHGEPTWSKIHARITQGTDGWIYFTGTLNDGNRAGNPEYHWSNTIPGGQLYRYNPKTGKTELFANLPPARATATVLLDHKHNIWWCNLEAGPNALFALNLKSKKVLFKTPDGSIPTSNGNRNFALARDGSIYFNGKGGIWKYNPKINNIVPTKSAFHKKETIRSSTRESKSGWIYGTTLASKCDGRLFRYAPAIDKLEILGWDFLTGDYTTVCVLSPDERYLYYLPGAHGGASKIGTPVVQYEIATGTRKVIAFLREAFEKKYGYIPAGTYGVKISKDGTVLYVNFNGQLTNAIRKEKKNPKNFGLTAFAAIHIPSQECKSKD